MLQDSIVALIVTLAALYASSRYLPASWRQRLVYLLAARGATQAKMAQWLHTESSCGSGCDSCKACATPAPLPAEGSQRRVIKLHIRH